MFRCAVFFFIFSLSIFARANSARIQHSFQTLPSAVKALDSDANCCLLNEEQLDQLRPTASMCPALGSVLGLAKCKSCPTGTCRVNFDCYCPEYFRSALRPKTECENSFGASWPSSIGTEDKDWRSCSDSYIPPATSDKSCCKMTTEELETLRGADTCPDFRNKLTLAKCKECPSGTCRVNSDCYCPDHFLSEIRPKTECEKSFGLVWPNSIDEEDKDWRSCSDSYIPPPTSDKSCCEMTTEELETLRGADTCPDFRNKLTLAKCKECPSGTCRVNFDCYCPDHFLSEVRPKTYCEKSFGLVWPNSIDEEDKDWRSCSDSYIPPPTSDKSCCEMTTEELETLRGADTCPDFRSKLTVAKCNECPSGTCRVNFDCYCPDHFLSEVRPKTYCEKSFGLAWPNSIGETDSDWSECESSTTSMPPTSVSSTSTEPSGAPTPIVLPSLTASPSESQKPVLIATPSSVAVASPTNGAPTPIVLPSLTASPSESQKPVLMATPSSVVVASPTNVSPAVETSVPTNTISPVTSPSVSISPGTTFTVIPTSPETSPEDIGNLDEGESSGPPVVAIAVGTSVAVVLIVIVIISIIVFRKRAQ